MFVEFIHKRVDDSGGKLLGNFPHFAGEFSFHFLLFAEHFAGFVDQLLLPVFQIFQFFRRKLLHFFGSHRAVIFEGHKQNLTVGKLLNPHSALARHCVEFIEELIPLFPISLAQPFLLPPEIFMTKCLGQSFLEELNQILHVLLEANSVSGFECNRHRIVRLLEIVDEHPVGRNRFVMNSIGQSTANRFHAAGTGHPRGINVIVGMTNSQS